MKKQYFFLAGMPRSGNTLLSSILNQNKDIAVSANSFVSDIFHHGVTLTFGEMFQNFPDFGSLENYLKSVFDSYYKDWDAKYIIDRGPWGTENNLNILENLYGDDIKIICTVRDINEILASFIKLNPSWVDKEIETELNTGMRCNNFHKSDIEVKCEVLMKPSGQLDKSICSLSNLLQSENKKYLHLIEYNDLINDTENVIDELYDFLDIPYYYHHFTGIKEFESNHLKYDDSQYGCDLHRVRSTIEKSNYKVSDILPENVIKKYSNMEFWRNK
jgi:sulfotransferase